MGRYIKERTPARVFFRVRTRFFSRAATRDTCPVTGSNQESAPDNSEKFSGFFGELRVKIVLGVRHFS